MSGGTISTTVRAVLSRRVSCGRDEAVPPGRRLRARFLRLPRDIEQERVLPCRSPSVARRWRRMRAAHLRLLRRIEEHPGVIERLEAIFRADERMLLAQFRHPPPHPRPVRRHFAGDCAPVGEEQVTEF